MNIEFRAWDNSFGGIFSYWDHQFDNNEGYFWEMVKYQPFEKPEQFTNRVDKNGKKIYVGDLLKVFKPNTWLKGNDIFEVRFYTTEAKFAYWCYRINDWASGNGHTYNVGNNKSGAWCEIIGNIHQNPELIKQKTT
ncbi:MAG TPA: YopX family protein [Burkholderiales bacterium]|nr:YopX family protein [Burkholderiales bacterium]